MHSLSHGTRKPRLVLYGIGQFGKHIVRLAAQKNWPIVAAYNRAGAKVGQDVGRLAGLERDLGVVVQDCDTASYEGLNADIGIVTVANHLQENMPAYERLLGAKLNVLCHGVESYYPQGNDPVLAARIDALAKSNGVSFCGSGIWDMSRIWAGILLVGPCTQIRSLFHSSITDCARIGKEAMLFTGVGSSVAQFKQRLSGPNRVVTVYKTIPELVLVALGYTIERSDVSVEPVTFDEAIDCPHLGRAIPPGECVGTRIVAEVHTREGVTALAHVELRLFRADEVEHMFWSVDGNPVSRLRTEREDSGHATAACLFNRIPDVIAAPPGIVLVSQLGPLKHTALI